MIQAVLNKMDKEINALNERLEEKVALVGQLSAIVVELNSKVERMDKNTAVMKHRVEQMEEKHSDLQKDMIKAKSVAGKMVVSLGILVRTCLCIIRTDGTGTSATAVGTCTK